MLFLCTCAEAYLPVIMMHGIFANSSAFDIFRQSIDRFHPGQKHFSLSSNSMNQSLAPMWKQAENVHDEILNLIIANPEVFKNGYHLVGHSQGTVVLRAVVEMYPMNVVNFVSLAGALGGIYDCPSAVLCESATKAMYSTTMQKTTSFANYWKTPQDQHQLYLEKNLFLPFLDNEVGYNPQYKENFLRIHELHMFGSPADEVIKPWDASLFNYLSTFNVSLPMEQQPFYVNDTFGLRTLDKQGRLFRTSVPNIAHTMWTDLPDLHKQYLMKILY